MTTFGKRIALGLSALALAGAGAAVWISLDQSTTPDGVPPGATHYLTPAQGGAGTYSNWMWCSQSLRITQTYVWEGDSTDGPLMVREERKGGC